VEGLLEREAELGMLAGVVGETLRGHGGLVLVGGEAGVGKTSLVRALQSRVGTQARFLIGACEPLSVPVPLGALRELFHAAGGGDLGGRAGGDRLALTRGVLEALAGVAPAIAVIEDAHWADPVTLDLVRLLARRVEGLGVTIIVTYRDDEVGANSGLALLLGDLATDPAVRRLALRPLSKSAVGALAGPGGLDVTELARVTGGNPFLVVESIAAGGRLPASVRDAALARAGRLSVEARSVVDAAAVLAQRFGPALLESLAPGSAAAVEEALGRGVLIAEGTSLGFRHELIRDAIESSIPPPRRAALHARVLEALGQQVGAADHARLAHHAELGGRVGEAARYAMLAAADAERVGALREVRLQAERALRLGVDLAPDERFELLAQYSRAANFSSPHYEDAIGSAEQAVVLAERLGDPLKRGRALGLLAWALWSLDRLAEAKAAAEQAIAVLEPTAEVSALARAHSTHLRMEATAFDPEAAVGFGAHALGLADQARLEDVRVDIMISLGLAHGHRGEAVGVAMLAVALAAARATGLTVQMVRAYVNLILVGAALRDHALVDRTAAQAQALFEESHTPIPRRAVQSYVARSLLDRGRWDDARAAAEESQATWHGEVPVARAVLGVIGARRGEPATACLLEQAWEELSEVAEGSRHGMIRAARVEAAWLRGDHVGAREQLHAARASPATARFARAAGDLALWAFRYGVELAAPIGAPAAVSLELAGNWRAAVRAWLEAEAPFEAALAALPGDDRAAREALATLHRLGAAAAARAFSRHRAGHGASVPRGPRSSTLANAAGLTAREQEVLIELATGATNPAIARSLHLSERTVSHHVSAILRKLGAPNRLTAIKRARGKGLLPREERPG
jgi:DNA-binding CsgD family transcriptional regulator/tetratricopeptide (TPR) repeat protein